MYTSSSDEILNHYMNHILMQRLKITDSNAETFKIKAKVKSNYASQEKGLSVFLLNGAQL